MKKHLAKREALQCCVRSRDPIGGGGHAIWKSQVGKAFLAAVAMPMESCENTQYEIGRVIFLTGIEELPTWKSITRVKGYHR